MVQALSIRTKLILAMLALVASVVLMGVTANAANAAGVTEIRLVKNNTPYYVYIQNHESRAYKLIPPYGVVSYNQWVPWATNTDEFNRGKYIEVGFSTEDACPDFVPLPNFCPGLAIWQEGYNRQPYPGDKIRYTRGIPYSFSYNRYAPPMAGDSNTGGRRNLIITYTPDPRDSLHAVMQARLCYEGSLLPACRIR
jgi:hypothetical protein